MSRVGEVLVHEGAVSSAGLRRALTFQRYGGQSLRLGTILVGWNLADEESLLRALSEHHRCLGVPWSDLARAAPETVAHQREGDHGPERGGDETREEN